MQKCHTCNYEQKIYTGGVHESDTGSLRVYSEDDQFHCPRCDRDKHVTDGDQEST
jgi:Zn finger protein HypA/HybF involved in hydrogenase expression